MRIAVLAAAAALGLSACATDINKLNAAKYHDAGLAAERSGNYPQAETYFGRALVNARSGGSPDAAVSMSMYNLGRMMGYNCKYEDARNMLVASLELEEKVSGPVSGNLAKRLFELARLSFDRNQYADAASFYARAIPMGRKLGLEQQEPIALAEALDEYAAALHHSGQPEAAKTTSLEASTLRAAHPGRKAEHQFHRYNLGCPA